ncbi:OmpA family protein [Rhodomicrobium lacus]|uniref:OmpA family protein n=1 Tax=Rhodomicrobium lacus TaxID=2498452 RepID=UPI0026E2EC1C|nr:OmpA family protein [Rhodomicrobium lacus]WKW50834.1 OmpA family protein [Rhodomicrobium lacus]
MQRAQPEQRQQPRFGQDQGFGQRDRGGQQPEPRGQAQERGRQEFEPRKAQEQERPRQQPEQKKVQEQERGQPGQPQGGRFGQQPGGAGQPQGGRFGEGTPQGTPGGRQPQGQGTTGFGSAGGQGTQQPGGAGQAQGGRFGEGAPQGTPGGRQPQGQGTTGFGSAGGQGTQQPGGAGQAQGGRFEGAPQGTPGGRQPQGQGTTGFGSAGGQGTQQPGGAGQPQGGRAGQGAPGGASEQSGGLKPGFPGGQPGQTGGSQAQGQGPAGFGQGAQPGQPGFRPGDRPQFGGQPGQPGAQPPFGGGAGGQPQFGGAQPQPGNRPPFGAGFSPEQRREVEERDTRRIELGRKIEEDQRRQADRERSREGLEERTRLQNERFRDIHAQRHERFDPNGVRFIEEPGNRKIFRLNNQTFIRHDETANFGHFGGRQDRRPIPGGGEFATFHRPDGSRVEVEVDRFGRPIRRVRILPDGRRFTLFENRALAAGLGLAAIGAAIVMLPPPAIAIPRDDYIVDAGVASEEVIYDTLYAPPVEPLPRSYSLDEVLASASVRDRMRSVRLNTIHFDFGSWEVRPDQAPLLQGIADSINRIVQHNPGEVFLIEGHTDAVGTDEDNLSLSDRRAQAVADVLTQYYQVPRENLVTQGYGEQFLLIPTQGPEIRNRRVVIRRLTPLLQSDQGRYSNSEQGPRNDYRP